MLLAEHCPSPDTLLGGQRQTCQLMELKLAGGAARPLLGAHELQVARALITGEPLATPVEDFGAVGQLALAEDDHGLYRLAPMLVRHAAHTRFLKGRAPW